MHLKHRWSKWEQTTALYTDFKSGKTFRVAMQYRICTTCNKVHREELGS